jgi:hypothetical protein
MSKIILFFALIFTTNLMAKELVICPLIYLSSVKKTVEANGDYDKFKHCAVSCLLALRCPAADVLELGIIKELIDVVGPGDADIADIEADHQGIKLATSVKGITDKSCMAICHTLYTKSSCR